MNDSQKLPDYLREQPDGLYLSVKAQPRASKNEVGEALGSELKIKVTAPPVDSAANEALIDFLATKLGCPKRAVTLIRGQAARHKVIRITGMNPQELLSKLGTKK